MRRNIPALFFVIITLANWAGHYLGNAALASATKPAILPLLAASVLVYALNHRLDGRKLALLVCAELFGFAGDILLLSSDFPLFAGGIAAFLFAGHFRRGGLEKDVLAGLACRPPGHCRRGLRPGETAPGKRLPAAPYGRLRFCASAPCLQHLLRPGPAQE